MLPNQALQTALALATRYQILAGELRLLLLAAGLTPAETDALTLDQTLAVTKQIRLSLRRQRLTTGPCQDVRSCVSSQLATTEARETERPPC